MKFDSDRNLRKSTRLIEMRLKEQRKYEKIEREREKQFYISTGRRERQAK